MLSLTIRLLEIKISYMKTHKDLEVWKKSIDFVVRLYETTSKFPTSELYGINSQLRRAAVSIPTNIAEGAARIHRKELLHFTTISIGSASEIETLLIISRKLNYLNEETFQTLNADLQSIFRLLIALKKSLLD